MRRTVPSGSPFESAIGFSRAVRSGAWIAVSGTAPLDDGGRTSCPSDVYGQTKRCIEIMLHAIEQAGGTAQHVIRTRIMLTDITRWREAARAHGEAFGEIKPACTFLQVVSFIDPEWLVETEADCLIE